MAQDPAHPGIPPSLPDTPTHSGANLRGEVLPPPTVPLTLRVMEEDIVLRPERPDDADLLAALFRASAFRDLAAMPVDASMKEALLRMQFTSQTATYRAQYPAARFDIIERRGAPIGRIVIDPGGQTGCIVDYALAPEVRAKGLGTAVLTAVLERFAAMRRPVRSKVLASNEASLRMCHRVGFKQIGNIPPYMQMEWRTPALRPDTVPSNGPQNTAD